MVRHHPPGVLRIISKPRTCVPLRSYTARSSPLAVYCSAPAAQSAVHPGMPGRVSAHRLQPDTVIGTVFCTGGQRAGKAEEEEAERGPAGEDKDVRAVYGRLPPAAPAWSAPGEKTARAVRHPGDFASQFACGLGWKASESPKPSTTPVSTRYAAAPAAALRPPPAPAPASRVSPRPLKAVCRQVHMRTQANISGSTCQSALSGCELCCSATPPAPARTTHCGCNLSRRETGVKVNTPAATVVEYQAFIAYL